MALRQNTNWTMPRLKDVFEESKQWLNWMTLLLVRRKQPNEYSSAKMVLRQENIENNTQSWR